MFVCCWIIVFINTLFIISTPENIYLHKNIFILGGLEAEMLTRIQIWSAILYNGHHWNRQMFVVLLDYCVYKYFIHHQYP